MHVSEYFNLGRTQPSLDFVDVHTTDDVTVFIDPRAIRMLDSEWSRDCQAMLQSFFSEILDAVALNNPDRIRELILRMADEPDETHLGWSKGRSRGRGLGGVRGEDVADSLSRSHAAKTGLLKDLEDSSLMVPGVGPDIISDMTTNVIRGALIGYTQAACRYYGIPMESQFSGPVWNPNSLDWQEGFVDLPRTEWGKLLLVPKSIVRHALIFDKDKYFNGYLAPHLEGLEIEAGSQLVRILKNGSPKVYRDDLKEKYGNDKLAIVAHTAKFPEALERYRASTSLLSSPPLSHAEMAAYTSTPEVDFIGLMEQVEAVAPGNAGATMYHRAAEALVSALFYPFLANVKIEAEINEGRKRIDLLYDNVAGVGFFQWLGNHYGAPLIPIECKNYSREIANPELDQLAGRFSPNRGKVGLLLCRNFDDKDLFLQRCRDTASEQRGFIIPLDDSDLRKLAEEAEERKAKPRAIRGEFSLLREVFDKLIR